MFNIRLSKIIIALVPLTGLDYQHDNVRVYGIIKQLVLDGPSHSYIMPFDNTSDGCAVWLSLLGHFEGDSYWNRNVEEAYTMLESIHYEGKQKRLNFEKIIKKCNEAQVKATPALSNNFQEAANFFIAHSITPIQVNMRNIGALSQNPQQPDGCTGTNIRIDTQSITSTLTPYTNLGG